MYDDDRFVCPNDDTLVQRYILAVLYFATAGNAWDRCYRDDNECREEEDAESYLSASSECEWYGSECFADGLIESVTLGKCGLMACCVACWRLRLGPDIKASHLFALLILFSLHYAQKITT